jgi:hypothetical protein
LLLPTKVVTEEEMAMVELDADAEVATVVELGTDAEVATVEKLGTDVVVATVEELGADVVVETVEELDADVVVATVEKLDADVVMATVEKLDADVVVATVEKLDADVVVVVVVVLVVVTGAMAFPKAPAAVFSGDKNSGRGGKSGLLGVDVCCGRVWPRGCGTTGPLKRATSRSTRRATLVRAATAPSRSSNRPS